MNDRVRLWGWALGWVWALVGGVAPVAAAISESTPAVGLVDSVAVAPAGAIKVLSIGLTGDGAATLDSLTVTVADLSSATGIDTSDLAALRLYTSLDTVLNTAADTLLATAALDSLGVAKALVPSATHVPPAAERFYLVAVAVDSTAVDHRAFKVGFAAAGVATSQGGLGTAVAASDTFKARIAVTATRLVFTQAPADTAVAVSGFEVVSGKVFSTQPVVSAQDALGNTDLDFDETVSASVISGAGTLGGTLAKAVVNGKADFVGNALVYSATADGEIFTLGADDAAGGTDLTGAAMDLEADVVAAKLVFTKQPSPLLGPGDNFAPDSVLVAVQDTAGLVDTNYQGQVTIAAVAVEDTSAAVGGLTAAPAATVTPQSGVAAWHELRLDAADVVRLKVTSGSLTAALSDIAATPGVLQVGAADSLVADNALAGLAGVGGGDLVFNALALRAVGERIPLTAVKVAPVFSGLLADELRNIDLVLDLDADGRVGAADRSVLAAAREDSGSGVELTLSVADTLPADTLRHYLLVADLDHTVRATDALRVDIADLAFGSGLATGVAPVVPVRAVAGRDHAVTGSVSVQSIALERPRVGQSGKVTLVFDTASDLAAGDEIAVDFPADYGVAAATVDAATTTPSGVDPTKSGESAGRTVVLTLGAQETRGRYRLVLDNVQNPAVDQGAAAVLIRTRLADDTLIDSADASAPGLDLVAEGRIGLGAVALDNGYAGRSGQLRLDFTTSTALAAGDEIELVFPAGFDLAAVGVGPGTQMPSGGVPVLAADQAVGQTLVLRLPGAEAAGAMSLVLDGVGFPALAGRELAVAVATRQSDGQALDLADETPAQFALQGRLQLAAAAEVAPVLAGLAGVGGRRLALSSFAVEAVGDTIPLQAVELLPHLSGVGVGELSGIDIVHDADGDGALDGDEVSVAAGTVGHGGDGVPLNVVLAGQRLAPGQRRAYLIVADIAAGIDATNRIAIDAVSVAAGAGLLGGATPALEGDAVAGTEHGATGLVDLRAVELQRRQTGLGGGVVLVFATTSLLVAGDRIRLVFPDGFDLGQAALDGSSRTPSGVLPTLDPFARTRQGLELEVAAAEDAGEYRLVFNDVFNPAIAAAGLTVAVASARADGTPVDDGDPTPFRFAVVAATATAACQADFDGDGRVYFDDLFLFGDAFGSAGSSVYDLDGSNGVDLADFALLNDVFGQRCAGVDPVDKGALAVRLAVDVAPGTAMDFALVRAGRFTMGSPADESGREADEGPQRRVALSQSFYLGQFEVTQAQWQAVMGTTPWAGLPAVVAAADHPAVYISWSDAQAFVQALNAAAGDSLYRLPWEAEWEYAARAGTSTRWSFGDEEGDLSAFAWTRRVPAVVSELVTHPVGSKRPNAWELYDMHGSAAEWVGDYYGAYEGASATDPVGPGSGSARVLRGGGLTLAAADTRSAARDAFDPEGRLSSFGFRIVRRIAAGQ